MVKAHPSAVVLSGLTILDLRDIPHIAAADPRADGAGYLTIARPVVDIHPHASLDGDDAVSDHLLKRR